MILLVVKTIVVYPVLLFCGRIVLEDVVLRRNDGEDSRPTWLRVSIATVWVITSCAIAILVPNIAVVITYLGSLAILFVFILPGACLYIAIFNEQHRQALQRELPRPLSSVASMLSLSVLFIGYGMFVLMNQLAKQIWPPPL